MPLTTEPSMLEILRRIVQEVDSAPSFQAALDVLVVLRLAGMPPGTPRAVLALVATAVICGVSLWGIVATQLGFALGLTPWDSALKLGLHHGWTLLMLAMTPLDWIALLAAPWLAAWWSR